jgi:hypothetical protein
MNGVVGYWKFNDKNSSGWIMNSASRIRDTNLNNGADINAVGLWDTNAGLFNGSTGYALLQNLAVDTTAGAKNTISFWMKWNGTETKMPFSWSSQYDLYFTAGCFGFNTYQSNAFGVPSAGLANKWVHVVAVFYNGVPSAANNALYINGIKQNIYACAGSTTNSRTVTSSARVSGGFDGYYMGGSIEEFAIWNRALSDYEAVELYRKSVSRLDLNIYSCADANCVTKTGSQYISNPNNSIWMDLNSNILNSQYLGFDANFKKARGLEDYNADYFWVNSFLKDFKVLYYK